MLKIILSLSLVILALVSGCSVATGPEPLACRSFRIERADQLITVQFDSPAQVTAITLHAARLPAVPVARITADGTELSHFDSWSTGQQRLVPSSASAETWQIQGAGADGVGNIELECDSAAGR